MFVLPVAPHTCLLVMNCLPRARNMEEILVALSLVETTPERPSVPAAAVD